MFYRHILFLLALLVVIAQGKTIKWKGYDWTVRKTNEPRGPGPNYFNDSNVEITSGDKLTLYIRQYGKRFSCASLTCNSVLGYGIYAWDFSQSLESVVDKDMNVIVGLFLYKTDEDEIDIEWARWGDSTKKAHNINYVAQPDGAGHSVYYHFPEGYTHVRHQFNYQKDIIEWKAIDIDSGKVIFEWTTTSHIPTPDELPVCINFWMMSGLTPAYPEMSVSIDNFAFNPPEIVVKSDGYSVHSLVAQMLVLCLVFCFTFLLW